MSIRAMLTVAALGAMPILGQSSATVVVWGDAPPSRSIIVQSMFPQDDNVQPRPGGYEGGSDAGVEIGDPSQTQIIYWVDWRYANAWGDGEWACHSHKPFSFDGQTLTVEREWKREIVGGGTVGIKLVSLKFEASVSAGGKDECTSTGRIGEWVWFFTRPMVTQNNWKHIKRTVSNGSTKDETMNEGYIQATTGVDWNPKKVWGEGKADPTK